MHFQNLFVYIFLTLKFKTYNERNNLNQLKVILLSYIVIVLIFYLPFLFSSLHFFLVFFSPFYLCIVLFYGRGKASLFLLSFYFSSDFSLPSQLFCEDLQLHSHDSSLPWQQLTFFFLQFSPAQSKGGCLITSLLVFLLISRDNVN